VWENYYDHLTNMATFTKISDSETPVVSVNPLNKIAKVNDNVYGGFTEYVVVHSIMEAK
jgi:hypothetical protein